MRATGVHACHTCPAHYQVGYCRLIEIRKLNGKTPHPRWSVTASDASLCTAVVLPFVPAEADGCCEVNRNIAPPLLVPMLSFGRQVSISENPNQSEGKTYTVAASPPPYAGGPKLRSICIDPSMFSADAMHAVSSDLEEMKVAELKEELQCRGKPSSGPKPLLLRRLHAAIMCEIVARRDEEYCSDSSE